MIDNEWSLSDDHQNEIVIYKKNENFVADIFYNNGGINSIVKKPTSFPLCKAMCEAWARNNLTITYANENSGWMLENKNIKATSEQIAFLKKHNAYSFPISKAAACTKIRKIVAESKRYYRKSKIFYDNTTNQKVTNKEYSKDITIKENL